MENAVRAWWFAICGPTIYRVPDVTSGQSLRYEPNKLEVLPSIFIHTTNSVCSFLKWTVLFWSPWFFRNLTSSSHWISYSRFGGCVTAIYVVAILIRGMGRLLNRDYQRFIEIYQTAENNQNDAVLEKLTLYSFSSSWPAQFDVRALPASQKRPKVSAPRRDANISTAFWPITWLIAHTIGIRIAYPGCTGILNSMTLEPRLDARDHLRQQYGLRRVGLRTRNGDFVEAFYVDRRGSTSSPPDSGSTRHGDTRGEIMVICCEGNASYPEIGTPVVPLSQGYSVLAWNHPGFGCSSNLPFPDNEQNAVEAVLLFALHHLHFKPHQIYLFGWSIGGYTVTWAAMNYPEIAGVILDATFDDLDELAKKTMPDIFYPVILAAIRHHMDLNNLAQLITYNGPVRIIRRAEDEIISTSEPPSRLSNRGTHLFVGLMKHRFPHLLTKENESLLLHYLSLSASDQDQLRNAMNGFADQCGPLVLKHLRSEALARQREANTTQPPSVAVPTMGMFPSSLGSRVTDVGLKWKILLYLVSQYHIEAPGTHCAPLDPRCFQPPWSPFSLNLIQPTTDDSNSEWVMD